MNAMQIKTMNAEQCMKEIRRLDAKADIAGRPATKTETATIEKLKARINELDPDSDD